MAKVTPVKNQAGDLVAYRLNCPGCEGPHVIYVGEWTDRNGRQHTGWTFNGDVDAPTFNPSLLVHEVKYPEGDVGQPRCHSFIRGGKIQFLGDCGHPLKNQTVGLADV